LILGSTPTVITEISLIINVGSTMADDISNMTTFRILYDDGLALAMPKSHIVRHTGIYIPSVRRKIPHPDDFKI
jgi:hypothetical protein